MTTTSDTAICNGALQLIGTRSTIASLTEESNEAHNCRLLYEPTRDEILRMVHWNFARKTAVLSLLKSAPGTPTNPTGATQWSSAYPAPPWLYEYAYPSDCLLMRQIIPQVQTGLIGVPLTSNGGGMYPYVAGPVTKFEIATDTNDQGNQITVILTNMYQAIGQYTMLISNPSLYDPMFVEAMKYAMAAKLAMSLTGLVSLSKALFQRANDELTDARAINGNEGPTSVDSIPDWIRIRDSDSYPDGYGYYIAPYSPLYTVF